jgi:tetratricopeptide (TPR) repeat protein
MQTTANLWEVLCRDLEEMRTRTSTEQHRAAAERFREAAAQVFRPGSPRLCDALEISGDVCQASGFLAEAARDFEEALTQNLAIGATGAAARVAAKLALLLDHMEKAGPAQDSYLRALELFDADHDHTQHCMLLSNLAALEKRTGQLESALSHYNEAIELASRLYGEVHPETALAFNNLGVAQTEAANWVEAENAHMRALGIREKLFGAMHPEVAQSLGNLAVVYHSSGNHQKAEAFYRAALKTYNAFLAPGDPAIEHVTANFEALKKSRK